MVFDLDANATYVPGQCFQQLVLSAWQRLGNPSSIHRGGQRARAAIEEARQQVKALVGAGPHDQVIFTSGATEANNAVIASVAKPGATLIASAIEHPCVLEPLRRAAQLGANVSHAPADAHGEVTSGAVAALVNHDASLVSVMAANNETGVVNDLAVIAERARQIAPKALIHSDAAQMIGKLPLSFSESLLDVLTLSGHKLGALSGVGALVVRHGVTLSPFILGGPQEGKMRGGTENVLGIISLGVAASDILTQGVARGDAMRAVRDTFEQELLVRVPDCVINGNAVKRLPNTTSVFIPGIRADDLLVALDLEGIYVSSGAACSSGKPEPSHVLSAMGQSEERVRSTVRVSFRADHERHVGYIAAEKFAEIIKRMRARG